ncbi:hypothetical protein ANN_26415 [Periplaneta americana]|uniref:Uncharacterized protein n=1 Tax=Periplaneta americana TaxID=6978 RepID=A0ABQ8RYB4_PERAM|nr:hypothetical protein ANN_26415 [Periplaneta americana]
MGNACYYSVEKLLSCSLLSKNVKVRIYKTVILPVVLYGCEIWTLTLREEHRLRVFENKVLRKIFGAKRDEVTGEWRKLHNTELQALHSSPDIIRNIKSRRLRWAGHVARMGESRNAYRVLVGRPEGKRPLGRPRRRWEDNIKMDLREVGYDDRDWINLALYRDQWRAYVRAAMNLRSAVLMFELAWKLSKDNIDLLWWAIVGVTEQVLLGKVENQQYVLETGNLQGHVARLSYHGDIPDDENSTQNKTALKITYDRDLQLALYRHWTVEASLRHSMYSAVKLKLWTLRGEKKLHELLAEMGLPLVQSRQKFGAMDLVLRQEFHSMIAKLAEKYHLDDIVFASFTLQYGFRNRYCAADVVYAVLATLESTDEETKQNYQVEISNRFATLESSDEVEKELHVNSVWENIRDSIKIAAEQSIGYYETKKKKPWFDEDCCIAVETRKQAKLKFLQDPVEANRDHYFNERREASRTLRNKKRGYLKEKLNEVETNSKNKNIRDLYKGKKEFKNGHQPRVNVIKDENGDLLADSPSILNRWKNYFAQLLNVHRPNRNDWDEIEIQTTEPFIPEPTLSEVEIAIENLKKTSLQARDRTPADCFLDALDALSRQRKDILEAGIEKAKRMLTCIFKQVQAALDMHQVISAGPFIYLVLQEGTLDAKMFSHPHCITLLAHFALRAYVASSRNRKAPSLPLIASAPHDLDKGTCLIVGIPPTCEDSPKNFFGKAFERAAEKTSARMLPDYFDSSIVQLKIEDRTRFFDALTTLLS